MRALRRNREPAAPPVAPPEGGETALLDALGPVEGAHALVIGPCGLEAMCGLLRRGCSAATEVALLDRPLAEPAEIAVVASVGTLATAARAVALAWQMLIPGGRIALRDPTGLLGRRLATLLHMQGFSAIRTRVLPDGVVLCADRPFFHPIARA
jgi:hypothetical protein